MPLEAWSTKGISAIASRLGRPIIMDAMTAKMCTQGKGRTGYARVLVEVEAKKGFQDTVDIHYRDSNNATSIIKYVKVKYMWKPQVCEACSVFGHNCQKKNGIVNMEGAEKNEAKSTNQSVDEMRLNGGKGVTSGFRRKFYYRL